jgi:hypothetical protein
MGGDRHDLDSEPRADPPDVNDRRALEGIARNGLAADTKVRHARVLLRSDRDRPGGKRTDPQFADALGMHVNTVARVRKTFVTRGVWPTLERKPRVSPPVPPTIDGRVEAHPIALGTGPPAPRFRWTMGLLAGELVRCEVDSISGEAGRRKNRARALKGALVVRPEARPRPVRRRHGAGPRRRHRRAR